MFIFNRNTHTKPKAHILVGASLIVFFSILLSILLGSSTYAKMDSNTKPSDRAASYSYWKGLSKCVTSHMRSTIKTKVGENGATTPKQGTFSNSSGQGGLVGSTEGEWFDDLDAWVTVYPDGRQTCGQVASKALKLWGWDDAKTFLTASGYKFDSNIPGYVRSNDNGEKRFEGFKSAVLSKVGNVVDLLDNSAKHALYTGIFTSNKGGLSACSAKRVGLLSEVDKTQRDAANANEFRDGVNYTVLKVGEGTTAQEYVYTYLAKSTSSEGTAGSTTNYASTWNYRGSNYASGTGEQFTCASLIKMINDTANAFARWNNEHKDDQDSGVTPIGDTEKCTTDPNDPSCVAASKCVVDGIGWIICPVFTFMGGVVDAAYGYVASLLDVQPLVTTGDSSGAYQAWVVMRNIANVAFVIVFLIIIFSQLTGMGVSNYGVKKSLPRLVIAAILVNISFWICAIAVDVSNIAGSSVNTIFNSVGASIDSSRDLTGIENGDGWEGIVGVILAGGAAATVTYYIGLSALIPAIIAAFVAVITVFLVLVLRQALIILLIVIAPIAFVAFLLPNTEGLFTKWRKFLTTLLLMYPIIAALFGGSALASQIVMNSVDPASDYAVVIQIMGACIAIVPLALTPIVMKVAGGVLNRFAGLVNNSERGPADRLRKVGAGFREGRINQRNTKALEGSGQLGRGAFVRWRARRNAVGEGRKSEKNRANTEYVAEQIEKNAGFRSDVAGGGIIIKAGDDAMQRALASSINAQSKLEAEELNAASVVLKNARLTQDQTRALAAGGSVTASNGTSLNAGASSAVRAAAIQQTVASADVAGMNALWAQSKSWGDNAEGAKLREAFADSLQSSSSRPSYYGQGAIAGLRTNDHDNDVTSVVEKAIKENVYSAKKIAAGDKDELNIVAQVASTSTRISDNDKQRLMLNAEQAITDPLLKNEVAKNIQVISALRENQRPGTGPNNSGEINIVH